VPAFGAHKGATTESSSVFHLWQGFSIGAVIIGGFVTVLFVYAILRFRRKGDNIPRQAQYHLPAEVIYTVVPILVVFGLSRPRSSSRTRKWPIPRPTSRST